MKNLFVDYKEGVFKSLPVMNAIQLSFKDGELEDEFRYSYDKGVRIPLRLGIIISLLSWYSSVYLIYALTPDKVYWFAPLTLIYIGSYFGFIIYATYNKKFVGYYHLLGAISNSWAGMYAIYFCHQFEGGISILLPALIFIMFFGSYMIRLRWVVGSIAMFTYILTYHIYLVHYSLLSSNEILLLAFVAWMVYIFSVLASRMVERNVRINFLQKLKIEEQKAVILSEKEFLLKEVHHRVKNNLQLIVSLINLQLSRDEKDNIALHDFQSRILSMSLIHKWVRQEDKFEKVNLEEFTSNLIEVSIRPNKNPSLRPRLNVDRSIEIDIDRAISLGLVLNEFVLGYLENEPVDPLIIEISLSENIVLVIFKNCNPFRYQNDTFSKVLVESLVEQIDGEFDIKDQSIALTFLQTEKI